MTNSTSLMLLSHTPLNDNLSAFFWWPAVRGSAELVDKAHLLALSESRKVKKHKAVIPLKSVEPAGKYHVGSYGAISPTVGKLNELVVSDKELLESYDGLSG